jgi:hypothetical protein
MNGIHEVTGSIPVWSTSLHHGLLARRDASARQPPAQLARSLVRSGAVEGHECRRPARCADESCAPAIGVDGLCLDDIGTAIDRAGEANSGHGPPGARG